MFKNIRSINCFLLGGGSEKAPAYLTVYFKKEAASDATGQYWLIQIILGNTLQYLSILDIIEPYLNVLKNMTTQTREN